MDRLKFEHSEILNAAGVFWALKAWDMKRLGPGVSCLEPVLRSFRAPEYDFSGLLIVNTERNSESRT